MNVGSSLIDVVFFDVDGTLIDDDADWRRAVAATTRAITQRYPRIEADALVSAYYSAATQVWRTIKDARLPPWGNMDEPLIVQRVWDLALSGWPRAGDAVQYGAETYAQLRRAEVSVFPDVRECLAVLRNRYRLGVITNGSGATHRPRLQMGGLGECFETVTTTDCGAGKPLRAIFDHAVTALNVQPSRSVYVRQQRRHADDLAESQPRTA